MEHLESFGNIEYDCYINEANSNRVGFPVSKYSNNLESF
jgi:hypothetical protein